MKRSALTIAFFAALMLSSATPAPAQEQFQGVIGRWKMNLGSGCRPCTMEVQAVDEQGRITGSHVLSEGESLPMEGTVIEKKGKLWLIATIGFLAKKPSIEVALENKERMVGFFTSVRGITPQHFGVTYKRIPTHVAGTR